MELAPGAYLVRTSAPGYEPVQTSVAIARGETTRLHLALPRAGTIPEGFAYVPGGSFRYGAREDEETRRLLEAEPEHALSLSGFLIARHETTAAELRAFDPGYPAGDDELPARGLTWDQATAYAAWLDSSGRRPGARLCSEREWERAARGGDGRRYPHGDAIAAGDACARDPHGPERTGGPCPAGAHPRSRSVFGVDDLAGNVWEWTRDPPSRAQPLYGVLRGGSWADEVGSPWLFASNRGLRPKSAASQLFGARICVDLPAELAERDRR